jgi:hypothetical protein
MKTCLNVFQLRLERGVKLVEGKLMFIKIDEVIVHY